MIELPKTLNEDLAKHDLEYREFLGSGFFSVVLEVERSRDRSRHALKYLTKPVKPGELMLWPLLDHPNVLPVEAIFTVDEAKPMFLMPLADRTLSELLRGEGLRCSPDAFDRVRGWTKEVASGLAHMHRLGVAHMDLTLSNVLVTSAGVARVADFTLVCSASNPADSWGAPPHLAPPEACRSFDSPLVDPRSFDAWTLGTLALKSVFRGRRLGQGPGGVRGWFHLGYPRLKHHLRPAEFAKNVAAAFPASRPSEEDVAAARNFVLSLLRLDPAARATPDRVLEHEYLGGRLAFFPTDRAWLDPPPPHWEPLDEERHRREVAEVHARLSRQSPVEDGRLARYQGRAPWIRLDADGNRVNAVTGEVDSPDRPPAPAEQAAAEAREEGALPEEPVDPGTDRGAEPGSDSDCYSPTRVRALLSDADDFLARLRSAGPPETPPSPRVVETATAAKEGQTAPPVPKSRRRRVGAWAAAARRRLGKLFCSCLGRSGRTDE